MKIGGFLKFSLIDYPGRMACVVFTQGCNFRCPYCHNPGLVLPEKFAPSVPEEEVFSFLKSRRNYLDGVVISGGEPTIHADLMTFMDKIKRLGFLIKLDTNGSRPEVLEQLIHMNFVNYIAMDVKAPLSKYHEQTDFKMAEEKIRRSIELILESGVSHEFRTTVVKCLCSNEDLEAIATLVKDAQKYRLQKARINEHVLDETLYLREQYSEDEFHWLKAMHEPH